MFWPHLGMFFMMAPCRNIAVVTSEFHMPRTRAIFDYCYELAGRQHHGSSSHFQLSYHPVSDVGIFDPAVIQVGSEEAKHWMAH
jgi:hypothetical protein